MMHAQVILYGHDGCPGTERARRFFRARGIAVEEKNVFDPEVHGEWIELGVWATPVVVINGVKRIGFDEDTCEKLLRAERTGA